MSDSLKVLTDIWSQLTHSPLWVLIGIMTLAVGLTLKWVQVFPNRFIPLVTLPFSTIAYATLGNPGQIDPSQPYPLVILGFYGFLLGFGTWAAHRFILKRLEKFLPDGLLPKEFDSDPPIPLPDGSNVKPQVPPPTV